MSSYLIKLILLFSILLDENELKFIIDVFHNKDLFIHNFKGSSNKTYSNVFNILQNYKKILLIYPHKTI